VRLQEVGVNLRRRWTHLPPAVAEGNAELPVLLLARKGLHEARLGLDNLDDADSLGHVAAINEDERLRLGSRVRRGRVDALANAVGRQSRRGFAWRE